MDLKTAERLAKLRKERGYSQEELAERLGVSRQAVSKWERGESSPDTDNLIALAALYKVSLDELLRNGSARADESEASGKETTGGQAARDRGGNGDFFSVRSDRGEEVRIGTDGLRVDDGKGTRVTLSPFRINVKTEGTKTAGHCFDRGAPCEADGNGESQSGENFGEGRGADGEDFYREAGRSSEEKIPVFTRGKEDRLSPRVRAVVGGIDGAIFFGTLAAFLLWGFLGGNTRYEGDWGRSWLALFAIPVLASLVEAFAYRDPVRFAFPLLVAAAYLAMGLYAELWHPGWAIFFSIPLYYMIADPVKRALSKR